MDVGSLGLIDGTVLTLQAHHRSTWIWEHGVCIKLTVFLYIRFVHNQFFYTGYRCAHMQTWWVRTLCRTVRPSCFALRITGWILWCISTWSDPFGPCIDYGIGRALATGDTYIPSTCRGGRHHVTGCCHIVGTPCRWGPYYTRTVTCYSTTPPIAILHHLLHTIRGLHFCH